MTQFSDSLRYREHEWAWTVYVRLIAVTIGVTRRCTTS